MIKILKFLSQFRAPDCLENMRQDRFEANVRAIAFVAWVIGVVNIAENYQEEKERENKVAESKYRSKL